MKTVAKFEISYQQYLDRDGKLLSKLPAALADASSLVPLYRHMVLTRTFDSKAIALQRTGQLGTFASCLGQEAIGTGVGSAMRAEDVLVPSYRDYGAMTWRGVPLEYILLYWGGDERGSDFPGPREDFPIAVPISTQISHAVGVAKAFQIRKERRVAVTTFGDGATSKGDFYESLNAAGLWKLPLVFVLNNNQYAISLPRSKQSAAETLAQKAVAAGMDGYQVDGNDVIAVRQAMDEAMDKARRGGGPTLIEMLSYRLSDHTTADDASRYRDADEVKRAWEQEPILRLRNYLAAEGAWDAEKEKALTKACGEQVQAAVERYQETPAPTAQSMFEYLYAELPEPLREQRDKATGGGAS